jgi:AraC family transcriptional regulator
MKNTTVTYYKKKVDDVLLYIDNHLSENLSTKELSDYAGISFFHFHRILKGMLNEPIATYIDRVRLDTAVKLIRYSDEPFSSISTKIGYSDVSAFSKAFSKEFGLSPQEFKSNREIILNTRLDYLIDVEGQLIADISPKIIHLPDKKVICIRVKGEYGGREVEIAWEQLVDYIKQNRLLGWNPEFFSVYYDDPDCIGRENCISDLCFTTKKELRDNSIFKSNIIKGGKYAVFRYKGPYERLWELYNKIYGDWLLSADCKLRDVPSVEKYLNYSLKTKPENLLTEIYIPIE